MFMNLIQTSDVRSFFKEGKLQPWDLGFADWEYLLWDLAAEVCQIGVAHGDSSTGRDEALAAAANSSLKERPYSLPFLLSW